MLCKRCNKNPQRHGYICAECHKKDVADRYKANRDKYNRRRAKLRTEAKRQLVEIMGGKCLECGYELNDKNASAFDFHHINPKEKDFNIGNSFISRMSLDAAMEELKKCILLCANCHRIEHSIF